MTAINLGLNGLFGWAAWMNTLTLETHRVYRIGMHLRGPRPGVIREVPVEQSPFHYAPASPGEHSSNRGLAAQQSPSKATEQQLDLF